ncbi:hypothetical protein K1719_021601 [Acacia pycnantha]|nr:hypothetical protein K1719_021601 [Acacia pycnantha]
MATAPLTVSRLSTVQSSIKPEPSNRKQVSSNWWAPLFGMSSEPDYIDRTAVSSSSSSSKAVEASEAAPDEDPGNDDVPRYYVPLGDCVQARVRRSKTVWEIMAAVGGDQVEWKYETLELDAKL